MIAHSALAVMLVGAVLLPRASAAATDDTGAWRTAAEEALLPALRNEYPAVEEWDVQPLVGKRQYASLQALNDPQGHVTQLGKRSAVRLTEDGQATRATLWFAVAGVQPVLVMKDGVKAGAALMAQLAEPAPRDVLSLSCTPLSSPAELDGMRAKRSLAEGEAVCAQAIELRPAVGRGDEVTVVSLAGAVSITAKAVAQQDGSIGQVLRVKSLSSGEVYLAAVRAAGEVVVYE